ncbi:MAG: sporulation sigma factor SigK [Clostridiales bacterium]|nr:sporulation sigma factor SigK [Clostridiales bacterium]
MLSAGLMILLNGLFVMLRMASGGSFPKPLSAQEEKELLERMYGGDISARDKLIEHNLRLVAHIINKC